MSLADENLRFVVLHAMADAVKKELGRLREGHTSTLLEVYRDTKGTAYKVALPGTDAVVATVTLRVPKSELEFPDGVDDGSPFLEWAAANHPDVVELEDVPEVPARPAIPAHERPFVNPKKLAELSKHFTKGDDGEVVDTTTGVIVDGARWSTPPDPNQFEVRYEGDGRDQLGTAYRAGRLNDVIGGTSLGAITAGPVVERRLVVAPDPAPTRAVCTDQCRGAAHEYVDQCDPVNCGHHHPGGPAVMTGEATGLSPARAALEEHADEYAAGLTAEVNLADGDVDAPEYERAAPTDEYDPWASPVPAGQPFDPGDW